MPATYTPALDTYTPALDVYDALIVALEDLTGRGYFATHATALVDDPDNYECRCCTKVPEGQEDRYVVATGGVGTTCTAAWIVECRDTIHLSWAGDADEIVDVLRSHGLDASWDGDPARTVVVDYTKAQARLVENRYWDEIRSYGYDPDDDVEDDEEDDR